MQTISEFEIYQPAENLHEPVIRYDNLRLISNPLIYIHFSAGYLNFQGNRLIDCTITYSNILYLLTLSMKTNIQFVTALTSTLNNDSSSLIALIILDVISCAMIML